MSSTSEDLKARQQRWENEAALANTHPQHWTLFEVIDEDLQAFSRQVEFAPANFPTYSVTLLRLYLSICSEIDVVAKLLCQRVGAALPDRPNMDHYRQALKVQYPNLSTLKITVRPMAYEILPWQAWEQDKNPDWWQKHQLVKHQRHQNFSDANLGNVLHAAAGLLVFLIYWHKPDLWALKIMPALISLTLKELPELAGLSVIICSRILATAERNWLLKAMPLQPISANSFWSAQRQAQSRQAH